MIIALVTGMGYLKEAYFRFYEELNDFLPEDRRKVEFSYGFKGKTTVKDTIEAIGAPHTEVDLILVDGESVSFEHVLTDGAHVSVYPVFESFDISNLTRLRPKPLRSPRFVLDVHLGKLAKNMRMLGFDILYKNTFEDVEIIECALSDKRIILTRDLGILKNSCVTHGYWVRSTNSNEQIREVVNRFDLLNMIRPFSRCLLCNGLLESVDKQEVVEKLPPFTARYFENFKKCTNCGKIYWRGSHFLDMERRINLMNLQDVACRTGAKSEEV